MANSSEAIRAYAANATAFQSRIAAGIDGVSSDLDAMNALILQLQTTPGPISAEDQATLDQLTAAGDALAARLEALDALNPPTVPTVP